MPNHLQFSPYSLSTPPKVNCTCLCLRSTKPRLRSSLSRLTHLSHMCTLSNVGTDKDTRRMFYETLSPPTSRLFHLQFRSCSQRKYKRGCRCCSTHKIAEAGGPTFCGTLYVCQSTGRPLQRSYPLPKQNKDLHEVLLPQST